MRWSDLHHDLYIAIFEYVVAQFYEEDAADYMNRSLYGFLFLDRASHAAAKFHLYRRISISSIAAIETLSTSLTQFPKNGKFVHTLVIESRREMAASMQASLLQPLNNLRHCVLSSPGPWDFARIAQITRDMPFLHYLSVGSPSTKWGEEGTAHGVLELALRPTLKSFHLLNQRRCKALTAFATRFGFQWDDDRDFRSVVLDDPRDVQDNSEAIFAPCSASILAMSAFRGHLHQPLSDHIEAYGPRLRYLTILDDFGHSMLDVLFEIRAYTPRLTHLRLQGNIVYTPQDALLPTVLAGLSHFSFETLLCFWHRHASLELDFPQKSQVWVTQLTSTIESMSGALKLKCVRLLSRDRDESKGTLRDAAKIAYMALKTSCEERGIRLITNF